MPLPCPAPATAAAFDTAPHGGAAAVLWVPSLAPSLLLLSVEGQAVTLVIRARRTRGNQPSLLVKKMGGYYVPSFYYGTAQTQREVERSVRQHPYTCRPPRPQLTPCCPCLLRYLSVCPAFSPSLLRQLLFHLIFSWRHRIALLLRLTYFPRYLCLRFH